MASDAHNAVISERRKKAITLRLAGMDWQSIADQLGYKTRGAACQDVTRALEANRKEEAAQAEQLRYVEAQRLDRLQAAVWAQAVKGDARAVETILSIMGRRARMLGLDAPVKADVTVTDALKAEIDELLDQMRNLDEQERRQNAARERG